MASNPEKRRLGSSPVEIVPLGVGCWAWGDQEYWRYGQDHGPQDVIAAFEACLDAGLDFFDTAEAYAWGKGEQILGSLIRKSGRELVVATKYAPLAGRGGAAAVAKGLAGSLKRLRASSIDLYQLHWADRDEAPIGTGHGPAGRGGSKGRDPRRRGQQLSRNRDARGARRAGAPRHSAGDQSGALLAAAPLPRGRRRARGLSGARRHPVGVQSARPGTTHREVLGRHPAGGKTPRYAVVRSRERSRGAARRRPRCARSATTHGVAAEAIAIAWLLAKPEVVPIAGAKTGHQARSNAAALARESEPGRDRPARRGERGVESRLLKQATSQ